MLRPPRAGELGVRRRRFRMSVCPKCGFTFAWDGARCGHCNYPALPIPPEEDRNELMERRILYKASKHNLPSRRTLRFQDLAPELQSEIRGIAGEKMQG